MSEIRIIFKFLFQILYNSEKKSFSTYIQEKIKQLTQTKTIIAVIKGIKSLWGITHE